MGILWLELHYFWSIFSLNRAIQNGEQVNSARAIITISLNPPLRVAPWLNRMQPLSRQRQFGGTEAVLRRQKSRQEIGEAVGEDRSMVGHYFGGKRKNPVRRLIERLAISRPGQTIFDRRIRIGVTSRRVGRERD